MLDLKLKKQQLSYDIKLQEKALETEFLHLRNSFADSLKTTFRIFSQKMAILLLARLLRSKKKSR